MMPRLQYSTECVWLGLYFIGNILNPTTARAMHQPFVCSALGDTAGLNCKALTSDESQAFIRALKIEKLKAPLFPSPRGAGDTNYLCITRGHFMKFLIPQSSIITKTYHRNVYCLTPHFYIEKKKTKLGLAGIYPMTD